MMRSLYSGVSGLKNHQTRMDVIGNNISNVNTTGFKSSRATFSDMLSQNLSGASAPQGNVGGVNPKQIGLGSSVAAIDLLFTNGSVQSTGVNTDLCLSSTNSLFILNTGNGTAYTRNGDFQFDADGNYVQSGNGYYVQGWMANDQGGITTGGAVGNITIPSGKSMAPVKSTVVNYTNNLNSEVPTIKGIRGGEVDLILNDGKDTPINGVSNENYAVGGSYVVKHNDPADQVTVTNGVNTPVVVHFAGNKVATWDPTFGWAQPLSVGSNLNYSFSEGESAAADQTASVTLTLENASTPITVTNGTYKIGDLYKIDGSNQLNDSIPALASGETLVLKLSNGESVSLDAYAGGKVGDAYPTGDPNVTILSFESFSKIQAMTQPMKVEQIDETFTIKSVSATKASPDNPVTVTLDDDKETTYVRTSGNYKNDWSIPYVTTVTLYDSLGVAHDTAIYFTKTKTVSNIPEEQDGKHLGNEWIVSIGTDITGDLPRTGTVTEGKTTITMEDTLLQFYTDGRVADGSGILELSLQNGSDPEQTITVNLAQLTQYAGGDTIAGKADGNAAGTLASVSIDSSGVITGTYTNGMKKTEAQIALQRFNNPGGLEKIGESLYQDSNNAGKSGEPGTVADMGATLTPAALEMSNVDIADQFTDMIITQRGFQANSKIITVSDEMLETLINTKR